MTCKTRVSTRSVLSPVSERFGTTRVRSAQTPAASVGRIAANCCDSLRTGLDAPGVLLVHIHAQVHGTGDRGAAAAQV